MTNKLLSRLVVVYGPPETHDVPAYFAEMFKLMRGFAEPELDKAADIVMRSHKGRAWPAVSEILTACEDARQIISPRKGHDERNQDWTAEAFKFANEAIASPLGVRAAREGWIGTLHAFLRKHRTTPTRHQEAQCIREAREFDAALSDCLAGRGGVVGTPLGKLGLLIQAKRDQLADRATNGVVE